MKPVWKKHLSLSHTEQLDLSLLLVRTHSSVSFRQSVYNSSLPIYGATNNFFHPVGPLNYTSIFFISKCSMYHRSEAKSFKFYNGMWERNYRNSTEYRRGVSNGKSHKIDSRKGDHIWLYYSSWFYRLGRDPVYHCLRWWWEVEACQIYSNICSRMTGSPPRFFRSRGCYSELYF